MMSASILVLSRRTASTHRSLLPGGLLARSLSTPAAPTAADSSKASWISTPARPTPSAKALQVAAFDAEKDASDAALESEKTEIQKYQEQMNALDPQAVFQVTTTLPDPVLPDNHAEIAALDPAHKNQIPLNPDGSEKWVSIKQEQAKWPGQAPLSKESSWIISFQDNGETGETWSNPLMGWVSSADPLASNMRMQMSFDTAQDAKYFCEKRGWKFIIDQPILRKGRDDEAQYQDVFLPQIVTNKMKRDGHKCDHWFRDAAGASHYFRPLKYHGDGVVRQHGPNREQASEKDAMSYYKLR